jgi:hypothetical protein
MTRKTAVSKYLADIGRKGGKASGKARMEKLTPEHRSSVAKNTATDRWKTAKKKVAPEAAE